MSPMPTSPLARLLDTLRRQGPAATLRKLRGALSDRVFFGLYLPLARLARWRYTRSYYGPRFRSNFGDKTFGFYVRAGYDPFLSDFLDARREPFCFLDVGANQGLYTLLAARNPACTRVFAFEPVARTCALLRDNVVHNGQAAKVVTVQAAISDTDTRRQISTDPQHTGVASLHHRTAAAGSETIDCISSATLAAQVGQARRLVVKVDTEGHEPVVIDALRRSALWPEVEVLFFEVDGDWFDGEALIASLVAEGFVEVYRSRRAHFDVMLRRASLTA